MPIRLIGFYGQYAKCLKILNYVNNTTVLKLIKKYSVNNCCMQNHRGHDFCTKYVNTCMIHTQTMRKKIGYG